RRSPVRPSAPPLPPSDLDLSSLDDSMLPAPANLPGSARSRPEARANAPEGFAPEHLGVLAFRRGHWRRLSPKAGVEFVARAAEDAQLAHDQGRAHGILDPARLLAGDGRGRALSSAQADEWCTHCTPPEWPPSPPGPLDRSGDIYVLGAALYVLITG